MKRKIFLFLLTVFAITCMFVVSSSAATTLADPIDDVYYTIDESKLTATVNTKNKTNTATIIEIPSEITYNGNTYEVTAIENNAFSGNKTMVELRILSEHITKIPYGMISNTYDGALEKIYIDFSIITEVAQSGLNPSNDTAGNSPKVNSFYYYDAKAFIADGSDVKITCPDFASLTNVGQAAFQGAQFEKLVIPASASLSIQCFRMVQATEVIIEGEDRTGIPNYCFGGADTIRKITVKSRNLQTIGTNAFNLDLKKDGNGVHPNCEIYIDMSTVKTVSGSAFIFADWYDQGITTVQWYNLEGEKIVDLSSVEVLGGTCFASSNLGSAYIIWPKALSTFEDQAFRLCNINQVAVINGKDGANLSVSYYSLSSGNTITGFVCNENVTSVSTEFPNATFAVLLGDSVKINSSKFVSSSTPVYCKEITINTSFNKFEIATGAPLMCGICGYGAEVKFADATSLTLGTFNHTEDEGTTTVPSCTVPEGTEYRCVLCDAFIRYDETAPATGHTYDENAPDSIEPLTCTTNEIKHYTCSTCSEQFIVITAYAAGHKYTVVSYPVVSTPGVEGTKRFTCSNFDGTCGDYYEYAYRMLPDEQDVRIEMNDGTKLVLKSNDIWQYKTLEVDNTYSCWLYNGSLKGTFVVDGVTYNTSNVKAISVPYGFTKIDQNFLHPYSNIKIIDLTDVCDVSLPSTFRDNGNVTEIILGNNIKLQSDSFRFMNNLSIVRIADGATVVFPSNANPFSDFRGLDKIIIGDNANVRFERNTTFNWNSSTTRRISAIEIGDNATVYFGYKTFNGEKNLATITFGENGNYTFAGECFQGAPLTALNIPASSNVTFDGTNAFKNCTALESVWLPANVTEIKSGTFNGCTALTEAYLLGVTSMADNAFYTGSDTAPLTIYHHAKDAFTYTSSSFGGRTTNGVILYTASNMTELTGIPYTIYCGIPHTQYEHTEEETCLENGYIGYKTDCPCGEAVYDVTYTVYTSTSDETTSGSYGSIVIIDEFDGHNNETTVVFGSFTADGTKTVTCSRCGEVESTEVLGAIIVPIGYSIRDGGTGISTGYKLNQKSLEEYERVNGKLEIGLIIVNGNSEFNGSFLTNEFKLNSNYGIQLAVSQRDFALVNCSVVGFTDAEANLKLIFTAYVIYEDENGNKLVEYIQRDGGENYYADTVSPETNLTFGVMTIGQVQEILDSAGNIDTPKAVLPSNDEDIVA